MLALRAPGQEGPFFSTCSSPAGTRAALFIFLWLEIKEFIGFILKSESFKNKSKASRGLFSPLKEQSTETKWCSTRNDITFGQQLPSWFEGCISFRLDFPSFFSPSFGSVRLCLHSLDRVYKYGKKGRQNKVSNFISSKNISSLSSGELTFPFKF